MRCGRHGARRRLARIDCGPGDAAAACRSAEHQTATGQRGIEIGMKRGGGEYVVRARGPGRGVGAGEMLRVHQQQLLQSHILHRAGGAADIARVGGLHQYDTHVFQHRFTFTVLFAISSAKVGPWGDHAHITLPPARLVCYPTRFSAPVHFSSPAGPIMQPLLNIAVSAARKAGTIITRALERVDSLQIESKSRNDFVSEVAYRAEQEIIQTFRNFRCRSPCTTRAAAKWRWSTIRSAPNCSPPPAAAARNWKGGASA